MAATLLFTGAVSADSETGQHGDYLFTDSSSTPGAKCTYFDVGGNVYAFHTMTVVPPSIWWPNTSSGSNTEHGTVGWSFKLQRSLGLNGTWQTFKTSPTQKATAYEDSVHPYGAGTKAPFTKMKLNVDTGMSDNYAWRAVVKATWFKRSGGVLGTETHRVIWYTTKAGTSVLLAQNFCVGGG